MLFKNLSKLKKNDEEKTLAFLMKHGLTHLEAKRYTDLNFKLDLKALPEKKKELLDKDFNA